MIMPISYPRGYLSLSPEMKSEICNGAGAKGGIKVPNTMYGLDLTEAFNIHDFDYWMGADEKDKRLADRRMLTNCVAMIVNEGGFFMGLRGYRAMTYFIAVARYGRKAFYAEKGKN